MAAHTVTVTFDGDGSQTKKFVCHAPVDALCHATYYCDCERWEDEEMVDGYPQHISPDGEAHVGASDVKDCNLRDWFEGEDDPLSGSVTVQVVEEWEGESYSFHIAEEVQP